MRPYLGFGLGLRSEHYDSVISSTTSNVDWFEALTENYMVPGGKPHYYLQQVSEKYPLVFHGVGMGIANYQGLNKEYLKDLKVLVEQFNPKWVSDHLCWTGNASHNSHDLLPVAYTPETLNFIVDRITEVQDYLGQPILIENPSTYIQFENSVISEADFFQGVVIKSGCKVLLDVNNVYVNSFNHQTNPVTFIDAMPSEAIWQIHLAGHTNYGEYIIDTHDAPIIPEVLELYAHTIKQHGQISTMIEWDDNIPPYEELVGYLLNVKKTAASALSERRAIGNTKEYS